MSNDVEADKIRTFDTEAALTALRPIEPFSAAVPNVSTTASFTSAAPRNVRRCQGLGAQDVQRPIDSMGQEGVSKAGIICFNVASRTKVPTNSMASSWQSS